MLMLLKARGKLKINELAKALETNPRNIREFKKELITAGFNIREMKGRYGGYTLDETCLFPYLDLTSTEKTALKEAHAFIEAHPEFESKKALDHALDKVLSADKEPYDNFRTYINKPVLTMSDKEQSMLKICQTALQKNQCVLLTYQSLKEEDVSSFLIDPYEIIHYQNAYYVLAFSHKRNNYRMYRFSIQRMKDLVLSNRYFLRDSNFNIESFIGKASLIKGNFIEYHIDIDLDQYRIFKELYWGLNFKETFFDDHASVSFLSDDSSMVFEQLFTFGKHAKLVAPASKVKDYHRIIKDILHLYQD